ncbi:MAG TPA: hypothetical protein PLX97_00500, partial [Gemmatales bacterium]|nr:hypothetical protein [Gemmatales bacterium]
MPHTISSIAAELESLSASDFDDGQGMQKLSRVCEALERRADGPELIPLLFKTMERLRELDLGQPGPLVHTLEHWVG